MDIKTKTAFLDTQWTSVPMRQRQWHVDNQHYDFVYCKTCNVQKVNWSAKNKNYSRFCSSKCAHAHPDVRKKTEQTCLQRYGETTNLKTVETKEKYKQTCLEKYGVTHYGKTDQSKENFIKVSLERYGTTNPSKNKKVKEKVDKTNFERYGRKRQSQIHINEDIIRQKNDPEYMLYLYKELKMPVTEIANQLGVNHSQLCIHFKENLGIDISRHAVSWPEKQLYDFVKQYCPTAEQSNRKLIAPREIDIVVPEKKLAIEYNGLAWHGEIKGGKPRNYHLEKQKQAYQKGYRLVHIFSNEWEQKNSIVKSRLENLFGFSEKIPARKTTVKQIENASANQFLQQNHIQGQCVHQIAYGLFYDGQLVSVMTFGKSRFDKKIQWELIRFSNILGTSVVGGAGKLFAYFVRNHKPHSVVSYCDLRWNTGGLYKNLGFQHVKDSPPNYWYVIQHRYLVSRIKYQKHKLGGLLENYDPQKTEWENMAEHGYDRIWDCGNGVWHWKS